MGNGKTMGGGGAAEGGDPILEVELSAATSNNKTTLADKLCTSKTLSYTDSEYCRRDIGRQTDRQTDRQRDRKTNKQTDKQTDM